MRVCIIGPVAPFRSGIARHTTALARELARRREVEVSVFSFSRQYPSVLFPGESEIDLQIRSPEGIETDFCLDTLDPLSWRRTVAKVINARPDMVVIPAWTFFVALCLGYLAHRLGQRGIPVLMIVHNAADHEAAWWKVAFSRLQLRQATKFLTHNTAIAADLRKWLPDTPCSVFPHPVYDEYPAPMGKLRRKAAFELLFFGLVRPYKGLDIALKALAASGRKDIRFSIVGEFWRGQADTIALIERLGLNQQVELTPRYVSDQEAAEFFARCDAVVVPYRSATGSGVVSLAQWYRRPIIASDLPGLREDVHDGSTGWLFPAGDVSALADILRSRISRTSVDAMRPALETVCQERSWKRFADAVVAQDFVESDESNVDFLPSMAVNED